MAAAGASLMGKDPRHDQDPGRRGEQPGKRESEERNDPEVQPGARIGRKEPPYQDPEPRDGHRQG